MRHMSFSDAIDDALGQAMAGDPRILLLGEDVQGMHGGLFVRFGRVRVCNTPISEAAFLGAAVTASMAGLRPVVEIMLVDFVAMAVDALLNHAAKLDVFSGGRWNIAEWGRGAAVALTDETALLKALLVLTLGPNYRTSVETLFGL